MTGENFFLKILSKNAEFDADFKTFEMGSKQFSYQTKKL
jgi:hypothetical protein